jgi:hypothetical protein
MAVGLRGLQPQAVAYNERRPETGQPSLKNEGKEAGGAKTGRPLD